MSRRTWRVLLLDDDVEDALLFRKRCPERVTVCHVTTTARAHEVLQSETFDAAFIDYRLGADSGLDFVREVRQRNRSLPLVVVTGHQVDVLGENALLAGANDFIPKEHLDASAIERCLRWALIRRHVERQRDERTSRAAVDSLVAACANADMPNEPGLRRLAFTSVARNMVSAVEWMPLSARFASANERMQITGLLACTPDRFLGCLEGPAEMVQALLRRIGADPRHGAFRLLCDEPVSRRAFRVWVMNLLPTCAATERGSGEGTPAGNVPVRAWPTDVLDRDSLRRALETFAGLS